MVNYVNSGDVVIKRSLQTKLILGLLLVITPLVTFLYYSNIYAMEVVREQVSKSNANMLSLYTQHMDESLAETSAYLYNLAANNTDIKTINIFPKRSEEYVYSRIMLLRKFLADRKQYGLVDVFFAYSNEHNDIIASYSTSKTQEVTNKRKLIRDIITDSEHYRQWNWVHGDSEIGLVKIVSSDENMYVGAWLPLERLMKPMRQHLNKEAEALVVSQSGLVMASTNEESKYTGRILEIQTLIANKYGAVKDHANRSYLYVANPSSQSTVHMMVLIPEESLMKNLPFFRRAIVSIPFVSLLLIMIFLLLLKRVLLTPIHQLLEGMRRIKDGDLHTRLPAAEDKGVFTYLISAFNEMAEQIQHLKIGMYEEKLRVQQAEFKYLQTQIKPHFYLNTLNIISSLAVLKDTEAVRKLTMHLADYFRFTIRMDRQLVTLREECQHIVNYLEIQKLRFPDQLIYSVNLSKDLELIEVPPLTIQPFVENAIVHGLREEEILNLQLNIQRDADLPEEYVNILIMDNGNGFDGIKLKQLQSGTYFDQQGKSVGIRNVFHRLKMNYGEKADILFQNHYHPNGAAVNLKIPLK